MVIMISEHKTSLWAFRGLSDEEPEEEVLEPGLGEPELEEGDGGEEGDGAEKGL